MDDPKQSSNFKGTPLAAVLRKQIKRAQERKQEAGLEALAFNQARVEAGLGSESNVEAAGNDLILDRWSLKVEPAVLLMD